MPPKSALTEQLATGKSQAPAADKTSAPLKILSDPAFPCLRYAKGEVVEADKEDAGGFEETDVAKLDLPGTAPSSSLKPDQVRKLECVG